MKISKVRIWKNKRTSKGIKYLIGEPPVANMTPAEYMRWYWFGEDKK
jgi:hypothetical protein|tara:strand:+ start:408 stop:548 length:141 start_codon:yes stop_codon:yes gene_type:complete